jgi:hypothetical protein
VQKQALSPEVLQVWRLDLISWADVPRTFSPSVSGLFEWRKFEPGCDSPGVDWSNVSVLLTTPLATPASSVV